MFSCYYIIMYHVFMLSYFIIILSSFHSYTKLFFSPDHFDILLIIDIII